MVLGRKRGSAPRGPPFTFHLSPSSLCAFATLREIFLFVFIRGPMRVRSRSHGSAIREVLPITNHQLLVQRARRFGRPRDLSFIVPLARDDGGSEAALHGDHLSLFTYHPLPFASLRLCVRFSYSCPFAVPIRVHSRLYSRPFAVAIRRQLWHSGRCQDQARQKGFNRSVKKLPIASAPELPCWPSSAESPFSSDQRRNMAISSVWLV